MEILKKSVRKVTGKPQFRFTVAYRKKNGSTYSCSGFVDSKEDGEKRIKMLTGGRA